MLEVVKNLFEVMYVLVVFEENFVLINFIEIIKCEEFGICDFLLCVIVYVMCFINNVRCKIKYRVNKCK